MSKSKTLNARAGLAAATAAALEAGKLLGANLHSAKKINEEIQHDIKLELDVRTQKLIERHLHKLFPQAAILGEEGVSGDPQAEFRWVIDPIDGTVNFAYSIPHACVSIALQQRATASPITNRQSSIINHQSPQITRDGYKTIAGVVHDPFVKETWTATLGGPARLNGKKISVSNRARLNEAIISMGFAKSRATMNAMLPHLNDLVYRVRKIRIMGSAALSMVYVACGRFDAYIEGGVRLWDVAAGGLIVECAGGEYWREEIDDQHGYRLIANNGLLRKKLNVNSSQRSTPVRL
jgi:myo-inositol-1(or 4)-monophosphatase